MLLQLLLHTLLVFANAFGVSVPQSGCMSGDFSGATTPHARKMLKVFDEEWKLDATECRAGRYTIEVPRHPSGLHERTMLLMLDGKPVLSRIGPVATMLYNPNPDHADWGYPIVTVDAGHAGKDIGEIWYQTVPDAHGRSVTVTDFGDDGQADTRWVSKGEDVVKSEVWYRGAWHRLGKGCLIIGGTCRVADFKRWQRQVRGRTHTPPDR